MSKYLSCKGDVVCRYWAEFSAFSVFATLSFGLGIVVF